MSLKEKLKGFLDARTQVLGVFEIPKSAIERDFSLEGLKMLHQECGGTATLEFKFDSMPILAVNCNRCRCHFEMLCSNEQRVWLAARVVRHSPAYLASGIVRTKKIGFIPQSS